MTPMPPAMMVPQQPAAQPMAPPGPAPAQRTPQQIQAIRSNPQFVRMMANRRMQRQQPGQPAAPQPMARPMMVPVQAAPAVQPMAQPPVYGR